MEDDEGLKQNTRLIQCDKVKLGTVVEGDAKAPFSIATSRRCRGGRYSFPLIMLSVKQGGIKYHFCVFGMTWPGIEPRSPEPLSEHSNHHANIDSATIGTWLWTLIFRGGWFMKSTMRSWDIVKVSYRCVSKELPKNNRHDAIYVKEDIYVLMHHWDKCINLDHHNS